LTQAAVGAAAGVDQSMVSAYEHDRREPTWSTFRHLLSAAGSVADLRVAPMPRAAFPLSELTDSICAASDPTRRRRLVLDFITRYNATDLIARRALVLDPPASTGDQRWDALLAAIAEHVAFEDAFDAPTWCATPERFLDAAWFWVDLPSVRRRALISAPTAFRRRNVWVDRSDLDRR
jgi:transcriptional regulator with XRE-family HTH domain